MKDNGCGPRRPDEGIDFSTPATWGTREVARAVSSLAETEGARMGLTRRQFLATQAGTAATFLAMNAVCGPFFAVRRADARDRDAAAEETTRLKDQFIFDVQVHYVHDDFPSPEGLLSLRTAADRWDGGDSEEQEPEDLRLENFVREVFRQSQTKLAVLSNAPDDDKQGWFLTNEQALGTRKKVNDRLGRRALLAHGLIVPGQPGWKEEFEKTLALQPDAWKAYTLGDPSGKSKYPWRLNDEKLVYPIYERMVKAGIRNVCIHKGLLPTGYEDWMSKEKVAYADVSDVGPAAKDWPQLNFIVYHAGIQKVIPTAQDAEQFQRTGRIPWVTELAEIPEKYGVSNVYGEIGAAFAATCVAHPALCAGLLGTLIRGLGTDHVCWGTDSVWFGSPQWQIEAFRRIEIPEKMQKEHGFRPLGPADGEVRQAILGGNSARLYGVR